MLFVLPDTCGDSKDDTGGVDTRPGHLRNGLEKLWRTGAHSDVKVHVGDKTFNCHKTVLVASSPYFEALFSSGMREAVSGEITFHEMAPSTAEHVLEYLYTENFVVSNENVIPMLEAALLLDIKPLSKRCKKELLNNLTVENCLELWKFSTLHNCKKLKKHAFRLILDNFAEIVKTDNFMKLSTDEMIQIVKDDSLGVPTEEVVVESVLRWAEKAKDKRSRLERVFPYIRLAHVSIETLLSLKCKSKSKVVQEKLDEAWNYKVLPARRHEMSTTTAKLRNAFPFEEVLILFVNGQQYRGFENMVAYSFIQNKWFTLSKPPCKLGNCFRACCHGDYIYVIGGCSGYLAGRVLRYSCIKNKWQTGTGAIHESRCDFGLAAFTDAIYAFGGEQPFLDDVTENDPNDLSQRVLGSVERYNISSDIWEVCNHLVKPTYACSVAVSGTNVLIFGPFFDKRVIKREDFSEAQRSCYIYSTITNDCTLVTNLIDLELFFRTVKVGKSAFIIHQEGEVIKFHEDYCLCEEITEIENFDFFHFGVVHHANKILVIGGQEALTGRKSKTIISFDTETSEVSQYPISLPVSLYLFSSFVITIDKKSLVTETKNWNRLSVS